MIEFKESKFYKLLQDFFINNNKETFLQMLAEFYNRTEGIIDKNIIQDGIIKELRELYLEFNEKGIDENIVREKVNYFLENSVKIKDILAKLIINTNKIEDNTNKIEDNTANIENINSQMDTIVDIGVIVPNYKTSSNKWHEAIEIAKTMGTTLIFPKGTYYLNDEYKEIELDGYTVDFCNSTVYSDILFRLKNSKIKNISNYNKAIYINGSNSKVQNVTIKHDVDYTLNYGIVIETNSDLIENIIIENCSVYKVNLFGFNIMDKTNSFSNGEVNNVSYINCNAYSCGGSNIWATGFCIEGINKVNNITYENCLADDNIESGFHFEDAVNSTNIVYNKCISTNNGIRKASPAFGAGFFANNKVLLNSCITYGNYTSIHKNGFVNIINHRDTDESFSINKYSDEIVGGNFKCGYGPFGRYALYPANFKSYQCRGVANDCFKIIEDSEGNYITNLRNAGTDTPNQTLQCNLIKINPYSTYILSLMQKRIIGSEGTLIVSLAEFDINLKKVKDYTFNKSVTPTDDWSEISYILGKTTTDNTSIYTFDSSTRYISISLIFCYLATTPTETSNKIGVKNLEFIKIA